MDPVARPVRYLACDLRVHDLTVLDYSLLSLLSYFDEASPAVEALLHEMFSGATVCLLWLAAWSSLKDPACPLHVAAVQQLLLLCHLLCCCAICSVALSFAL